MFRNPFEKTTYNFVEKSNLLNPKQRNKTFYFG